jgi:hypothetical protein
MLFEVIRKALVMKSLGLIIMTIEIWKDFCNIAKGKSWKMALRFLAEYISHIPLKCYIFVSVCK